MSAAAAPPILVVGAGPTGLLLAAELRRRGADYLLIDAADAPMEWDRATVVHPRSMEMFEALGLADRFLEVGVRTRGAKVVADGRTLGLLDIELADTRYGFDLGISEEVTERIITGYLVEHGGAVQRGTRLVGLQPGPESVTATLEHAGERQTLEVACVVGCDGYRSAVRELAGIAFDRDDVEAPWAVFDAAIDGWTEPYDVGVAHLDIPPVILTPLPDRRWRVYLRPRTETSDLVAEATGVVTRYAPDARFVDVENPTRFRTHSRVAERFRSGRVLLAGDAAHVCSPAEGHGMNTGLQDAFNLGWKLALVATGASEEALLDSYHAERHPVAVRIVASGADAEGGQAMVEAAERAERNTAIAATFGDPGMSHHEAVAAAELDRSYAESPVVTGAAGGPGLVAGVRLPTTAAVEPAGGPPRLLHELTHRPEHTILVLGGPDADPADVASLVAELEAATAGSRVVGGVIGLARAAVDPSVGRLGPEVAEALGVDRITVLAVRPDRYVGLRSDDGHAAAVTGYLRTLTG